MNLLDTIKRDLGPYWRKEGLNVAMTARTLAHLIAQAANQSPSKIREAMRQANELLQGHGVEAIHDGIHRRGYWGETIAIYVNMGDMYDGTLLYDTLAEEFKVTTAGDWLEEHEREHVRRLTRDDPYRDIALPGVPEVDNDDDE